MAEMTVEALIKRAERAETKRAMFSSLMQDVYAFAMPERDAWSSYGYGENRQARVFDSTATVSAARFANRLQSALFPPAQRWARLTLPPELAASEDAQELQVDMEAAGDLLFRHIHASNFDMVANEWAQELGAGAATMLVENGRLGTRRTRAPLLRFQAIPVAMVGFDEGPFGVVEGVFHHQDMPARLLDRTYPDAKGIPDEIKRKAIDDPDAMINVLQATYYDPEEDRFRFEVIIKGEKLRIVSRSYRTNPWTVTRWTKAPGETHGRGPLTQALPDIRTLNKLAELYLRAGSLAVSGVWTAIDDGVLNPANVTIAPGTIIPVRSNGGPMGRSLDALPFNARFDVSEAMQERLATRIRQVLFDDPLPPEVQVGLTATEVIERVRRFQADTGAFGRLQNDAVVPIVTRCLDILDQAGEFAGERFAGLMDALQQDAIRILATGPLSRAQDQADVQSVMSFMAGAAQLGELGMALIRSGVDPDRAGRYVAERMGVPQQLIPTVKELQARDQAQQQAEQEKAALASPAVAQVAGAVAGAAVQPQQAEPMR